jgi:tetratricopeptide (TPR) repeat protein
VDPRWSERRGNIAPVPLFRKPPRTRAEIVANADRARARGRLKRAAAGYREALAQDPDDSAVNLKLAPVLARLGEADESARCFRRAAEKHLAAGFTDRAAAVCVTATGALPLDAGLRLEVARLNVLRGRKADAVAALLDGGRALSRARRRPAAVSLLRRALEILPLHLEAGLALAPLLAAEGSLDEARALVAALEETARGRALRRVRWVAFRLGPSPRALWRWAASAIAGESARPRARAAPPRTRKSA